MTLGVHGRKIGSQIQGMIQTDPRSDTTKNDWRRCFDRTQGMSCRTKERPPSARVCVSNPVSKDTTLVLVLTYPTNLSTTVQ